MSDKQKAMISREKEALLAFRTNVKAAAEVRPLYGVQPLYGIKPTAPSTAIPLYGIYS